MTKQPGAERAPLFIPLEPDYFVGHDDPVQAAQVTNEYLGGIAWVAERMAKTLPPPSMLGYDAALTAVRKRALDGLSFDEARFTTGAGVDALPLLRTYVTHVGRAIMDTSGLAATYPDASLQFETNLDLWAPVGAGHADRASNQAYEVTRLLLPGGMPLSKQARLLGVQGVHVDGTLFHKRYSYSAVPGALRQNLGALIRRHPGLQLAAETFVSAPALGLGNVSVMRLATAPRSAEDAFVTPPDQAPAHLAALAHFLHIPSDPPQVPVSRL